MTTETQNKFESSVVANKQKTLADENGEPLSFAQQFADKETREHITPFAFRIDESLYGRPLAKPMRRGMAMIIDLILVSIFTVLLEEAITLCLAVFFFVVAFRKRKTSKKQRFSWRYAVLGSIFFLGFISEGAWKFGTDFYSGNYGDWQNYVSEKAQNTNSNVPVTIDGQQKQMTFGELMQIGMSMKDVIANQIKDDCEDYACYEKAYENVPQMMLTTGMDRDGAKDFIDDLLENAKLSEEEKQKLSDDTVEKYLTLAPAAKVAMKNIADNLDSDKSDQAFKDDEELSLIDMLRAGIRDLGISFGWAALYFTAFLTWLSGRTPGKWLFGIRVIKLDGRPITLWESFERYGGYGAGLATGLLGFLQVFWDPNRQAIHDKISGTVVVRD